MPSLLTRVSTTAHAPTRLSWSRPHHDAGSCELALVVVLDAATAAPCVVSNATMSTSAGITCQ